MGTPSFAAQELNIANVARDYHDHRTYNNHGTGITINSTSRIEPIDRLIVNVAHGALHDSAERGPDAPKCHPETRIAVQRDITGWIEHKEQDDAPKRILWLSGPAGSGKTAIAGTIADECHKKGLLAASFFFSSFAGSIYRRVSKLFISTLVYSLIRHQPIVGFKEEVLAAIEDDPIIFGRNLDQQLETLILKPLRNVSGRSDSCNWPVAILIDGLDECQGSSEFDIGLGGDTHASGAGAQKEILSVFSRASTDPAFPFRIVIVSRPEPVIRHFLSSPPCLAFNIFLDNKYDPDSDIRLFLDAMLSDIRRRFNLPSTWASKDVVDLLVREASGQFIYAATVLRFIGNSRLGSPQHQLSRLLEWRRMDDPEPFSPLDALYNRILHTSPDPLLAVKWLRLLFGHAANVMDASFHLYLKGLLESYPGQTEYVLGNLTSLVALVDSWGRPSFYTYHKSLFDFLLDPNRCSDIHVRVEDLHYFIGDRYYRVLRARGPESNAGSSTNPPSSGFLETFCKWLPAYIDQRREYTTEDVEWWLLNLHEYREPRSRNIPNMFYVIHQQCKWYHSLHACRVWRKAILRSCREHGWRLPTAKEMLQDRFQKIEFDFPKPEEYPLRFPRLEAEPAESSSKEPATDSNVSLEVLAITLAIDPPTLVETR